MRRSRPGSRTGGAVLLLVLVACAHAGQDGSPVAENPERAPTRARGGAPGSPDLSVVYLSVLEARGVELDPEDGVALRVLRDLGAHFTVGPGSAVPRTWRFDSSEAVEAFQSPSLSAERPAGLELQPAAARALVAARQDAAALGKSISPRAPDAARRSFEDTMRLWQSRVRPAIDHWKLAGRLTEEEGRHVLALPPGEQIAEVFRLEAAGLHFSQDFRKSITYSVAPPGTSQHLALLAFDAREHDDPVVRAVLARHGWYQTVFSDLPHFTFLGLPESALPSVGLARREGFGRVFWVVDGARSKGPETAADPSEECAF